LLERWAPSGCSPILVRYRYRIRLLPTLNQVYLLDWSSTSPCKSLLLVKKTSFERYATVELLYCHSSGMLQTKPILLLPISHSLECGMSSWQIGTGGSSRVIRGHRVEINYRIVSDICFKTRGLSRPQWFILCWRCCRPSSDRLIPKRLERYRP
jgi:hypothetical protein